jgi:branched-chain amino acid transport system substrate-binding protein
MEEMMIDLNFRKSLMSLIGIAAATLLSGGALAQSGTIRLGGLATLEGPFAVPGQDSFRGMEMALEEAKYQVAGKKIELIKESSNAEPDVAVSKARKLIEQDKVDVLIGPLSGDEGLAVKDYAKTVPNKTFLNGSSAAQDTTLRDPAPNFYRFSTDGVQWQAGLGSYVYDKKGYHNVVVVAEDYSFPYSQVAGFMTEFCAKGGHVKKKFWVPLGNKDYSSVVAGIPENIDAVYVALGGADAINFLTQYSQGGGKAPLVGGSITTDQTVLSAKGPFLRQVVGMASAGPIADAYDAPAWKEFVARYKRRFPDGLGSPSLFAHAYYIETRAALTALQKVNGDLSDNQKKFREALGSLVLETPTGTVRLDQNRNAIADMFVTEVTKREDGTLYNKVVAVAHGVNQTLGQPREAFIAKGPVSRDNPSCP